MQEDRPLLPRIVERTAQLLLVRHDAEASFSVRVSKRIPIRRSGDRPIRSVAGSVLQQRLRSLGGKMINQGQERVLAADALDVIQPLGRHAVVQQLTVRHTGKQGAVAGDVARNLDLAHDLADLDELRRARARMLFDAPAFRPAIRIVVLSDVAEQEVGRRLVHDHAHPTIDPNRPEVLVPGPLHSMELHPRLRRIELQIERRRLGGPLFLARQLRQAIRKTCRLYGIPRQPWLRLEASCVENRIPIPFQKSTATVVATRLATSAYRSTSTSGALMLTTREYRAARS